MNDKVMAGIEKINDWYQAEVGEKETPRWGYLNPAMVIAELIGIDEKVVSLVLSAFQDELVKIQADSPGFMGYFAVAQDMSMHIADLPIKGDEDELRQVLAYATLSTASHYHGYIQGHGDALASMEPKNRKERRHGKIVTLK